MHTAITQLLAIQAESSVNQKQRLLEQFSQNETFRRLLYYALNPRLTYKISEQTLRQPAYRRPESPCAFPDIFTVCETLSRRKALDDASVCQTCAFVHAAPTPEEREFYIKLLSKTLRLGITGKTVNKVIPGLLPEWEIQQAYPIEKYPIKPGTWFALTQKLNGVRATCYKGRLYARSGVPYTDLEHILKALEWDTENAFVLDGELTLQDKGNFSDNEAFRITTGLVNGEDGDKTRICYTVFDILPTEEFETGRSTASYRSRRTLLESVKAKLPSNCPVHILPVLYAGTDQAKIVELLSQMVSEDKEGLMVNLDVPYKCKRHSGILKVKRFYTMDLPITACEEGSGRLAGTLGAFVLDYQGRPVRVGSGFSDEQRARFWQQRGSLPGTLCEVKYKEISSDKTTGAQSLQFPVFVSLRPDKSEVSYG